MTRKHARDVLKNTYLSDFQRPNLFEIDFQIGSTGTAQNSTLSLATEMIQSVNLPMTIIGQIEIKRMGKRMYIPGEVINSQEVQVSCYSDIDGSVRAFFLNWMKNYFIRMDNKEVVPEKKFATGNTMTIYTLDGMHRKQTVTTLFDVWPKMVGEMSFSHESDNSLSTFPVAFLFSHAEFDN